MHENLTAFIIWAVIGALLAGIGVHAFFARKPQHFWANIKMGEVSDVRKYNRAVGKLFIAYGVAFILLGLPLLAENEALILLSVLGTVLATIAIMAVYAAVIEQKYKKK